MKTAKLIITMIIAFMAHHSFAQDNEGRKVELQFRERVSFIPVNDRYEIVPDTIYYANDGFRVFSGYDEKKWRGDSTYLVFTYPDWGEKKNQRFKDALGQVHGGDPYRAALLAAWEDVDRQMQTKNTLLRNPEGADTTGMRSAINTLVVKKKNLDELLKNIGIQPGNPVHLNIAGKDSVRLAMPKSEFEKLKLEGKVEDVYSLKLKYLFSLASGVMTIPFKLRPKLGDTVNFNITTDITLGAYLGLKMRISRKGHYFLVLPATLGLSYINVGNSQTSNVKTEGSSDVVPGVTWSTGLIFDLNRFNAGVVLGQDYASGVGDKWYYNKKLWFSFAIGYSFFGDVKRN